MWIKCFSCGFESEVRSTEIQSCTNIFICPNCSMEIVLHFTPKIKESDPEPLMAKEVIFEWESANISSEVLLRLRRENLIFNKLSTKQLIDIFRKGSKVCFQDVKSRVVSQAQKNAEQFGIKVRVTWDEDTRLENP